MFEDGLEASSLRLFTKALGQTYDEVSTQVMTVRHALKDKSVHAVQDL